MATGPLRKHPTNDRYFTDGSGKAIYLTGSHTWANLVDNGLGVEAPLSTTDPPSVFNYDAYLDLLQKDNHNFIRLWRWELPKTFHSKGSIYFSQPHPWMRSGPGTALDGKLKFDLKQFDQSYFDRLRSRVIAARDRGIYVSIMLFEGWWLDGSPASWQWHPFHGSNNVNGFNGDVNGDGKGDEINTLQIPAGLAAVQKAYVRKVIDTVNDLDNVLYEIANETQVSGSIQWQYDLISYIKSYQAEKPKQHPVGMTWSWEGLAKANSNPDLLNSQADWISLGHNWHTKNYDYNNPPAADGKKVNLADTDHYGYDKFRDDPAYSMSWVWKSFLRGHNPILMEDLLSKSGWIANRAAMGHTRTYANKMNLAAMTPRNDLSTTSYCLANSGQEYLVYQPKTGEFSVDLTAGSYAFEWFNPTTGSVASTGSVKAAGGKQAFTPPFSGPAVLYLKVASAEAGAASGATSAPKLGISGDKFTIDGEPTFLLGVSYFDALGWSNADLDALQARRFNLIRIFLDWGIRPGGNRTRSHFNPDGSMKNTTSLLDFVRACAARGVIVDVTILSSDSKSLGDWTSGAFPQTAVRNAVRLLAPEPNVFFDLVNEHNGFVPRGKAWSDSHTMMQSLMTAARQESGSAILTYSSMSATFPNYAGHVYTANDSIITANVDQELATGVDLMAPHPGREDDWFDRTDRRVTNLKNYMASRGRLIPVYLQEENRRGGGDATGEPLRNLPKEQFFQAAREAKNAGAAAWLFHTDAGFDMSAKNFFDPLDPVEREVVEGLGEVVFGPERNRASGSLRVHPTNPRYFSDGSGKAVYTTTVRDSTMIRFRVKPTAEISEAQVLVWSNTLKKLPDLNSCSTQQQ